MVQKWFGMLCFLRSILLATAWIGLSAFPLSNASASVPDGFVAMPIYPDQDAASLHEVLRFRSINNERGQGFAPLLNQPETFSPLAGESFNLGPAIGRFLVAVSVVNHGERPGEWLITTNRGAIRDFALDEWTNGQIVNHLDGDDFEQVRQNLQAYHAFTHVFTLDPGQSRTFLVSLEPVHSTLIPLEVKTVESHAAARLTKLAIYVGSSVGMLTIVLISMVIYFQTGRPQFAWMGIAELSHVGFVAHVGGYTTFYYLYDKGPWIYIVGATFPQIFAVSMAQFGRVFIDTKNKFRRLDRALVGFIIFGLAITVIQTIKNLMGDPVSLKFVDYLSGVAIILFTLILPYIAVLATRQLGSYYWPLIVSWGSLCLFVMYGTISAFGIAPSLNYNWHLTGPVGLLETIFAFWALVLYLNKLDHERMQNQIDLNTSLQEKLRVQEKAFQLQMDKENALSTIRDQENLIHASGHDSQHVLMALRTIIKFSEDENADELPNNLPEMLRSSAEHLEGIIGTTLANPMAGFQSGNFVALSHFNVREFLDGIEAIFGPPLRAQGMRLSLETDPDLWVVSDRSIIARIVSNILSNCLVHAREGSVSLSVSLSSQDDTQAVIFKIEDEGPGLPEHIFARLNDQAIDRMGTATDEKGSGFGLLSSKKLADTVCGELRAIKTDETGAVFELSLPHFSHANTDDTNVMEQLQSHLGSIELVVLDRFGSLDDEIARLAERMRSGGEAVLPASSDASSHMRGRLSAVAPLMLIKPISQHLIRHPLIEKMVLQNGRLAKSVTSELP